ncbi:MAG: BrnA antitoxin family protein [Gemmatimonadales bacterium]
MKEPHIVRYDPKKHKSKTDWPRVNALTDEEIAAAVASDPDAAPLLDEEWFRHAKLVFLEPKVAVSIRLERGVVDWFKAQGPRYQTRINAVLRGYIEARKAQKAQKAQKARKTR